MLELKLLGGFEARHDGGRQIAVRSRKTRALLAYLSMHPGKAMAREHLAALVWSEREEALARNSLSQAIGDLRKAFSSVGTLPLEIGTAALTFMDRDARVDALMFERLLSSGTPADLEEAERLYDGDFLQGIGVRDPAFEEWLGYEQARFRGMATEALTRLLDHRLEQKHHAALIATAVKLLKLDPTSEPAHRALMQCYADQGLASVALRQYRQCAEALHRELGIEPGEETRRLFERIAERMPVATSPAPAPAGAAVAAASAGAVSPGTALYERKPASVICAEITGAGRLFETLAPETADEILGEARARLQALVRFSEGTILASTENRVLAVFGAPAAQADHGARACTVALDMQRSVRRLSKEFAQRTKARLGFRAAIDSGDVIVRQKESGGGSATAAAGLAVQAALAVVGNGAFEGIRITSRTARLAGDFIASHPLGQVDLGGFDIPVDLFEVAGEKPARSRFEARLERIATRLIGRQAEFDFLSASLRRASQGDGQVVGIVGSPGAGKSRLVFEFTRSSALRGWRILQCAPMSHRPSRPWLPIGDLLRSFLRISPGEDDAVAAQKIAGHLAARGGDLAAAQPVLQWLLGLGTGDDAWTALDPRERHARTVDWVRVLLTAECEIQPLVLVFEDLQWFDPESLALLDALFDSLASRRLLLLASYRPDFSPGWETKTAYSRLRVDPLDSTESMAFLVELLGNHPNLGPLRDTLARRAGGNPLFLEEGAQDLIESGMLTGRRGDYRVAGGIGSISVPESAQAIISERIDRLAPRTKRLLQLASVVGMTFSYPVLRSVAALSEAELAADLAELQRGDFLSETRVLPMREFAFKHAITQEVAYGSLPDDPKRDFHRRVGDALERMLGDHRGENADVLAEHFERAGNPSRAARYFLIAADRARDQYANTAAVSFYSRALDAIGACAGADDSPGVATVRRILEARGRLRSLLGDNRAAEDFSTLRDMARAAGDPLSEAAALQRSAQLAVTRGAYDEGIRDALQALAIARGIADKPLIARSLVTLGDVHIHGIRGEDEAGVAFLEEALPICREIGDRVGTAEALCHLGYIRLLKGDYGRSLALFHESLDLARSADDRARVAFDLIFLGIIAMDLADFAEAERQFAEGIALAQDIEAQVLAAIGQTFLAWLEVKRGGFDAAFELLEEAKRTFEAAGARSWIPLIHDIRGEALLRSGDDAAALACFETALPLAREVEDPCWQSFALNGLAHVHGLRGNVEDAERFHEESLRFCAMKSDMWVRCRAEALTSWAEVKLHRGDADMAQELIARLKSHATRYGMRQFTAVASYLEGQALLARGDAAEAIAPLDLALHLSRDLGDPVTQSRAADLLRRITEGPA